MSAAKGIDSWGRGTDRGPGACERHGRRNCDSNECVRQGISDDFDRQKAEALDKAFCEHGEPTGSRSPCRLCRSERENKEYEANDRFRANQIEEAEKAFDQALKLGRSDLGDDEWFLIEACQHGLTQYECGECLKTAEQDIATLRQKFTSDLADLDEKREVNYWGSLEYQDVESLGDTEVEYGYYLEQAVKQARAAAKEIRGRFVGSQEKKER